MTLFYSFFKYSENIGENIFYVLYIPKNLILFDFLKNFETDPINGDNLWAGRKKNNF